jgi:hypothetical protein
VGAEHMKRRCDRQSEGHHRGQKYDDEDVYVVAESEGAGSRQLDGDPRYGQCGHGQLDHSFVERDFRVSDASSTHVGAEHPPPNVGNCWLVDDVYVD